MTNIHELNSNEYSAFISLWHEAFGDDETEINAFCDAFDDELKRFTLTDSDGNVSSALTLFKMGNLFVPRECTTKDIYVSYAICTSKEARGQGYGAAITTFAANFTKKNAPSWCGNPGLSTLSPASDSLISFYEPLGYIPFFHSHQGKAVRFIASSEKSCKKITVRHITPSVYNKRREQILTNTIHVSLSDNSLNYLAGYSDFYSFKLSVIGLEGIFLSSAPTKNERISLDELLIVKKGSIAKYEPSFVTPEEYDFVAGNIADNFNASVCTYSSPAFSKNSHVQAMLFTDNDGVGLPSTEGHDYRPYFAFPFD